MAPTALILWPIIGLAIFKVIGPIRGLIWVTMIGYLFLPEAYEFDLPLLPPYDKFAAVALTTVLGLFLTREDLPEALRRPGVSISQIFAPRAPKEIQKASRIRPVIRRFTDGHAPESEKTRSQMLRRFEDQTGGTVQLTIDRSEKPGVVVQKGDPFLRLLMLICLAGLFVTPFLTVLTNGETLNNGGFIRPALTPRDAISMILETMILLTPFFLAWRYIAHPIHIRELLIALVVLGLCYSLLVLFERRMSPQLHIWIYGYFQHSWIQHLRGGDFRPIVFLRHGLWVGFFLFTVSIAAFALSRDRTMPKALLIGAGLWMIGVLVLSKNLGALMLALMVAPVVMFVPRRLQIVIAVAGTLLLLSYPAVKERSAPVTDKVLELAAQIEQERAQSLAYRLNQEGFLLERGLEKPTFGWGGWGRWRLYNEDGEDISVSDGLWIITFGERGWAGYLSFYGLLSLPILFLLRVRRRKEVPPMVMGMALISMANLVYLIPNSTLNPIGLMMFGALAAFAERDLTDEDVAEKKKERIDTRPMSERYTRFPDGEPDLTFRSRHKPIMRTSNPRPFEYQRRRPRKDA